MNLYDNSNIECNKKIKIKYMISIIIFLLLNSFMVIYIYKNIAVFTIYK